MDVTRASFLGPWLVALAVRAGQVAVAVVVGVRSADANAAALLTQGRHCLLWARSQFLRNRDAIQL